MSTAKKIPLVDMHPTDIEAAVKRRFGGYAALARAWNGQTPPPSRTIHPRVLSQAAHHRHSSMGEEVIAWAMDMKPQAIWPSRYRDNGERIFYRAVNNATTPRRACNV